jgi:thiamine biosynthesis lipoprotein
MPAEKTFDALGTTAHVIVCEPDALDAAVAEVERELAAIDLACSRFRDDSELTALNRAGGRPFQAGPILAEALDVALRAAEITDGDVDPTVGRALSGLGWDCDFTVLVRRGEQERIELVPAGGWRSVVLDRDRGVVTVPPGVEIDLGATAKALAADRCARAAAGETGAGVLVNLGGDLSVAGPPHAGGWPVLVTDDHRTPAAGEGQTVSISSGGLATSSTTVRRWRAGGAEHHHIVDPRTGRPPRGRVAAWSSVPRPRPETADGSDIRPLRAATVADALTTAFMVLKPAEIQRLCGTNPGLEAWLLLPGSAAPVAPPPLLHFGTQLP